MNGQNGLERFVVLRAPKARAALRAGGATAGLNPSLSSLLRPRAAALATARAAGTEPEPDRTADAALDALGGARLQAATLSRRDRADLARDPDVLAASPSIPVRLMRPVSAARRPAAALPAGDAWGIGAVGADRPGVPTGKGVKVAILDTGVDAAHPAFAGVTLTLRDFTKTPPEANAAPDGQGHGTHCAGTIFGRDVGGQRIGVARGVKRALVGRVLDDEGNGGSEALFAGMTWAFENKAHVLSVSIGFDFPELVEQLKAQNGLPSRAAVSVALEFYRANLRVFDAVMAVAQARAAFGPGTVVVAATGNESKRPTFEIAASVPAAANNVIGVGALGRSPAGLTVAGFSNTNPDVCAPGVAVLSAALGGGLRLDSGTSMATPHVAGLAALHWEAELGRDANAKAEAVASLLVAGATTNGLAPGSESEDRGRGLARAP